MAWNKLYTDREPPIDNNVNAELGLSGVDQSLAGAPLFNISGLTNLGIGPNVPNLVDSQARQLISDTTWTTGKHSLKFGINFQWLQSYLANPKEGLGVFQFNGNYTRQTRNVAGGRGGDPFADFLLGISRQTDIADPVYANLRAPYLQGYVQDEWRATQRLTLNIGLRYEYNTPWVEKDNRIGNFDITNPEQGIILAQDGSRFSRSTVTTDMTNFAPRFGFAYRAREKTVVRGGYGIFYANYEGTGGGRFLLGNPPYTVSVRISSDSVNIPFTLEQGVPEGSLRPENVTNLRLTYFERDAQWPLSQQWNFNIQHELARDLLWETGYYGSKAQHLPTRWEGNFVDPGPGNINDRRRFKSIVYPGTDVVVEPLALIDAHNYFGNSLFHSFQTRLEKRFSNGFSMLGSYIWSKTIGDLSGFAGSGSAVNSDIQNPRNLRAERSLDNQHVAHRFVASYIYDLPFGEGRRWGASWNPVAGALLGGWTISGINTLATGQPMGLSVRGDPANTGQLNRPNVVGEGLLSRDERTLDRFFNTSAFVANDPFTYGNAGRNILFEPGLVNWDFAVFKKFTITERVTMQFRFESFNFTNTPDFGAPNAEVGNDLFGVITSAGRPRNLQLGLKFIF